MVARVFQGTVLGSPLWNMFFADSRRALALQHFLETVFADDLNAWRAFLLGKDATSPHDHALSELHAVQAELDRWGKANQQSNEAPLKSYTIDIRVIC